MNDSEWVEQVVPISYSFAIVQRMWEMFITKYKRPPTVLFVSKRLYFNTDVHKIVWMRLGLHTALSYELGIETIQLYDGLNSLYTNTEL